MKEGWKIVKIIDVATVVHGRDYKDVAAEQGYPVYGSGANVIAYANDYICEEGTTILGRKGTIDKPVFIEEKFWNIDTAFGIVAKECINKKYLYYGIKSIDWASLNPGGVKPSLTQKIVYNQNIPLPSLAEQERIVAYLDTQFAKIDAMKANAAKALAEAKALFQSALTEAMTPKEGWEMKKFGELCKYRKEHIQDANMKYVGLEHIESGTGRLLDFINSSTVLSSNFKFYKGDVLYGRLRPYLKKVFVADFDGCCSTEIFPIYSCKLNPHYIKYWFLTEETTNKINLSSAGCRMPRGNMNEVLKYNLSLPPLPEQERIVTRLDALSAKVAALEANYTQTVAECDALKQALLREVFE